MRRLQPHVHIHHPHVRFRHCVSQRLRCAGVAFKSKQRIVTETTGTPEAETVLADRRNNIVLIQQSRIRYRVLQIPENISGNAGNSIHTHVGQGFVPADPLVDFDAQVKRTGGGVSRRICFQHGVKVDETKPERQSLRLTGMPYVLVDRHVAYIFHDVPVLIQCRHFQRN